MDEKAKPIIVPIEIEVDEEKLEKIKELLDEIKISYQEVKALFR